MRLEPARHRRPVHAIPALDQRDRSATVPDGPGTGAAQGSDRKELTLCPGAWAVRARLHLPSRAVPVLHQRAVVAGARAGLIPAHGPDVAAGRAGDGLQNGLLGPAVDRVRCRHDRPLRAVPVLGQGAKRRHAFVPTTQMSSAEITARPDNSVPRPCRGGLGRYRHLVPSQRTRPPPPRAHAVAARVSALLYFAAVRARLPFSTVAALAWPVFRARRLRGPGTRHRVAARPR